MILFKIEIDKEGNKGVVGYLRQFFANPFRPKEVVKIFQKSKKFIIYLFLYFQIRVTPSVGNGNL